MLAWFGFLKNFLCDVLWFVAILMFAFHFAKAIIQRLADLAAKGILGLPGIVFGLLVGKRRSHVRGIAGKDED